MTEPLVKITTRVPPKYLEVSETIAKQRDISVAEVVREFMRSVIENKAFFGGDYTHTKREERIEEFFFCQACADRIKGDAHLIKYRDDVFRFCNLCVVDGNAERALHKIATYEAHGDIREVSLV